MKNFMILFIISSFLLASCKKSEEENTEKMITISMAANSLNDVYYSFANGEVKSEARTDWDIAFSVPLQSAAILINEGAGIELYCVGDTNAWGTVDTSNLQSLGQRFNNKSNWNQGAFNIVYSSMGLNFGWGTYNMTTHSVYGDSIFVIKLTDGSYKKLFIRNRIGIPDTYVLRWANIDGSEQVDTTFSAAPYYEKKNFIQYSLVNKKVVEAEPDKDSWDLIFTRYNVPGSPSAVTGVLLNPLEEGVKITGVAHENADFSDPQYYFTSQADIIGWDWKTYDHATQLYSIVPNVTYFVMLPNRNIYRIYFKDYSGSMTGTITFFTKRVV